MAAFSGRRPDRSARRPPPPGADNLASRSGSEAATTALRPAVQRVKIERLPDEDLWLGDGERLNGPRLERLFERSRSSSAARSRTTGLLSCAAAFFRKGTAGGPKPCSTSSVRSYPLSLPSERIRFFTSRSSPRHFGSRRPGEPGAGAQALGRGRAGSPG